MKLTHLPSGPLDRTVGWNDVKECQPRELAATLSPQQGRSRERPKTLFSISARAGWNDVCSARPASPKWCKPDKPKTDRQRLSAAVIEEKDDLTNRVKCVLVSFASLDSARRCGPSHQTSFETVKSSLHARPSHRTRVAKGEDEKDFILARRRLQPKAEILPAFALAR